MPNRSLRRLLYRNQSNRVSCWRKVWTEWPSAPAEPRMAKRFPAAQPRRFSVRQRNSVRQEGPEPEELMEQVWLETLASVPLPQRLLEPVSGPLQAWVGQGVLV